MDHSETNQTEAVEPLPGLSPWVGGKRNLAARLVARIEAIEHKTYAEPFVGMGGVFFRRRRPAPIELINDANGEVVNLFRVLKHHAEALLDEVDVMVHSRSELRRLLQVAPDTLTDIQRAARFYWLQRLTYRGKVEGRTFGASPHRKAGRARARYRMELRAAHRRLDQVTIDQVDFERFIRAYDRPTTLFYLDPPYWGHEGDYGRELFCRADHERLAGALRGLKGRFVLSMNDTPEVRALYTFAQIEPVEVTHTLGHKRACELIIGN